MSCSNPVTRIKRPVFNIKNITRHTEAGRHDHSKEKKSAESVHEKDILADILDEDF